MTLEQALVKIQVLEAEAAQLKTANGELKAANGELKTENEKLKAENATLKARNLGGRRKHDATWMASYEDFAVQYEGGMTIMEIVNQGKISRRTAYRYKTYYDELKGITKARKPKKDN